MFFHLTSFSWLQIIIMFLIRSLHPLLCFDIFSSLFLFGPLKSLLSHLSLKTVPFLSEKKSKYLCRCGKQP